MTLPITSPTQAEYAAFGEYVAATLGAAREWSGADILEDIAARAATTFGISVGDQSDDELRFWRDTADRLDIYYEPDDEDEEDDA